MSSVPNDETDAPRELGSAADAAAPKPRSTPPARRRRWAALVALAVLLVVVAGVLLLLPTLVRDRVVASARAANVELAVGRVSVGFSGVVLYDVKATIPSVPGVAASIGDVHADWSARDVRLARVEATLDGRASEIVPSLLLLYDTERAAFAGTAARPRKVVVVDARLAWTAPLGEGTRVSAGDVGAEIESKETDEIRATLGRFDVKTETTTLGPWSASFESTAARSRVRLLFDPPVPDGPSALYVWGGGAAPSLTVHVARSPFARLGLSPSDLGLPADAGTEVEASVEATGTPAGRVEGHAKVTLYRARLRGFKDPLDVKLDAGFAGPVGKPLDLERATATVGPFVADVAGTITPVELGVRADTTWRTHPIPCEKLVRAEVTSWGPLAATIHDFVRGTGALKVTGSAYASGSFAWDSRAPKDAALGFSTRETCGLSIFGL